VSRVQRQARKERVAGEGLNWLYSMKRADGLADCPPFDATRS
jgi:hypothetical protein